MPWFGDGGVSDSSNGIVCSLHRIKQKEAEMTVRFIPECDFSGDTGRQGCAREIDPTNSRRGWLDRSFIVAGAEEMSSKTPDQQVDFLLV